MRWALGRLAPGGALLIADVLDARRREELRRAIEEHRARRGSRRGRGRGRSCTSTRTCSTISARGPSRPPPRRRASPTSWASATTCCSPPGATGAAAAPQAAVDRLARRPLRRPARLPAVAGPGGRRLRHPHLGLDRRAEGDRRAAPAGGEPDRLDQPDVRGGPGGPRPVRHLALPSTSRSTTSSGCSRRGARCTSRPRRSCADPDRLVALLRTGGITALGLGAGGAGAARAAVPGGCRTRRAGCAW